MYDYSGDKSSYGYFWEYSIISGDSVDFRGFLIIYGCFNVPGFLGNFDNFRGFRGYTYIFGISLNIGYFRNSQKLSTNERAPEG